MFCPSCGSQNPDGAVFCASCGASLTNSKANKPAGAQPQYEKTGAQAQRQATYQPPQQQQYQQYQPAAASGTVPGKSKALISLILGIVGVVCWFFGYSSLISLVVGIVGVILARQSAAEGFNGGIRTAGMVLSVISVIGGLIVFIAVIACVACGVGAAGLFGSSY